MSKDRKGTNRRHKDRLFKALFGSPERKCLTLELYNAMNRSSYTDPDDIELSTIDDVVYMGMKNDVSFLFDQVMNLWEQQNCREQGHSGIACRRSQTVSHDS